MLEKSVVQQMVERCWPREHLAVEQVLGGGSQGTVFGLRGEDGSRQALKVIDTSDKSEGERKLITKYARREIKFHQLMSARTPYVVSFRDAAVFPSDKRPVVFLIRMELLQPAVQDDLSAMPRPEREALACRILNDVLQAVSALEKAGIAMRDIKLKNIGRAGETYKLLDFGTAREVSRRDDECATVCGSSDNIPPELLMGQKLIAGRSDVYGSGVMAFHVASPQSGLFDRAAFAKGDCGISEELAELIFRMTEPDPRARLAPDAARAWAAGLLMQRDRAFHTRCKKELLWSLIRGCPPEDILLLDALPKEEETTALLRAACAALAKDTGRAVRELLAGATLPANHGAALYYLGRAVQKTDPAAADRLLHEAAKMGWNAAQRALDGHPDRQAAADELKALLI